MSYKLTIFFCKGQVRPTLRPVGRKNVGFHRGGVRR